MSQCYSGAFAGLVGRRRRAATGRPATSAAATRSTADRAGVRLLSGEPRPRQRRTLVPLHRSARRAPVARRCAHAEVLVARRDAGRAARAVRRLSEERAAPRRRRRAARSSPPSSTRSCGRRGGDRGGTGSPSIRTLDRIGAALRRSSARARCSELDEQSQRIDAHGRTSSKTHRRRAGGSARERELARRISIASSTAHAEWTERLDERSAPSRSRRARSTLAYRAAAGDDGSRIDADPIAERFTGAPRQMPIARRRSATAWRSARASCCACAPSSSGSRGGCSLARERGRRSVERGTYAALRACEDLALPPARCRAGTELARADPFPPSPTTSSCVDSVLPAWLGIQFRQAKDAQRADTGSPTAPLAVMMVYDDSPAKRRRAPRGRRHRSVRRARTFVENGAGPRVGQCARRRTSRRELDVAPRRHSTGSLTLVAAMPQKWPSLPRPPKVGSAAPPVRLEGHYRGARPDDAAPTDQLAPPLLLGDVVRDLQDMCVPELLAFERDRDVQVVAITDETSTELDPFFVGVEGWLPAVVASDEAGHPSAATASAGRRASC